MVLPSQLLSEAGIPSMPESAQISRNSGVRIGNATVERYPSREFIRRLLLNSGSYRAIAEKDVIKNRQTTDKVNTCSCRTIRETLA